MGSTLPDKECPMIDKGSTAADIGGPITNTGGLLAETGGSQPDTGGPPADKGGQFEYSQTNQIFQWHGLGRYLRRICNAKSCHVQWESLPTTSFCLGIIGKVRKGCIRALCHVSLVI